MENFIGLIVIGAIFYFVHNTGYERGFKDGEKEGKRKKRKKR